VIDFTLFFRALKVAYDVRSSELRLVMSTQWLRPTLRLPLLKFESDLVCALCR
jgi:hypothetical protein